MVESSQVFAPEINRFFTSYTPDGLVSGFRARHKIKPGHLLHATLSGQVVFVCNGVEKCFSTGDLVLIDPLLHHDYQVVHRRHPWKTVCVHFFARPSWHHLLDWPELAPGFRWLNLDHSTHRRRVVQRLIACHRLANGPWRHRQALAEAELEVALTWCAELGLHHGLPINARLDRAMHYLHRHLADPLTQPQIARHVGWSPTHLRARFLQAFGCTPLQYLDQLRMQRAAELLRLSDAPVYQIAAQLGYDDAAYFSRRFRQITGHSPRQCRDGAGQTHVAVRRGS